MLESSIYYIYAQTGVLVAIFLSFVTDNHMKRTQKKDIYRHYTGLCMCEESLTGIAALPTLCLARTTLYAGKALQTLRATATMYHYALLIRSAASRGHATIFHLVRVMVE